jgi:hypothetical protein
MTDKLAGMYRLVQLPRYVWLVEAVDRDARAANRADVVGMVVLDSTHASRRTKIQPLAGHLHDYGFWYLPDVRKVLKMDVGPMGHVLADHLVRNRHATKIPAAPVKD